MRKEELYESLNESILFSLANLHTAVVCKVEAVKSKTINCKPVINRVVNGQSVELPIFEDVPPIFMSGGSSYTAHPIEAGDYCLVIISERCFDTWYNGDDFVSPAELRMHDYSDGFALVGIKNKSEALEIPDVITQIGDMFAQGNWEHEGDLNHTGNTIHAGNLTQTGNQNTTGEINSTIKVTAPILQGILQGPGGGAAESDQSFTAAELHANNGFTGSGPYTNFTIVDGIIISAS